MAVFAEEHSCAWRDEAEKLRAELEPLQAQLAAQQAQLEKLTRHVFGKRSEKVTPVAEELRKSNPRSREETLAERRAKRAARESLPTEVVHHLVSPEKRRCPTCGGDKLKPLGEGKSTTVYDYVPARLVKRVHVQETLACACGEGIVTAEGAPKPIEQGQYGAGLIAHVITAKCADSIPLYRQAKGFARAGIPINRTTLGDLFHAGARLTEILVNRLMEIIAQDEFVRADETTMRVLDSEKKGQSRRAWLWTFRTEKLIAYRFSASRSGETPKEVLGESRGYLQVDAYTGYNAVTAPERRIRVGCWAHARRKFFEAQSTAPEARALLDMILELYKVEHAAKEHNLSPSELIALRKQNSAPVLTRIRNWLDEHRPKYPPKSPLAEAMRYIDGQWEALCRFLESARIGLDNNASEQALRTAALGRKNYLFVGGDEAGANIAGLYSLVATCEANGVNPEAYLADVLTRLATHPNAQLDDLLPHRWAPAA
jgi:transposase